jgi:hypothetical protein
LLRGDSNVALTVEDSFCEGLGEGVVVGEALGKELLF